MTTPAIRSILTSLKNAPPSPYNPGLVAWADLVNKQNDLETFYSVFVLAVVDQDIAPEWIPLLSEQTPTAWPNFDAEVLGATSRFDGFKQNPQAYKKWILSADACLRATPDHNVWLHMDQHQVGFFARSFLLETLFSEETTERLFTSLLRPGNLLHFTRPAALPRILLAAHAYSVVRNRPDFLAPLALNAPLCAHKSDDELLLLSHLKSAPHDVLSVSVGLTRVALLGYFSHCSFDHKANQPAVCGAELVRRSPDLADLFVLHCARTNTPLNDYIETEKEYMKPFASAFESACYTHADLESCQELARAHARIGKNAPPELQARLSHESLSQSLRDDPLASAKLNASLSSPPKSKM